ncbi:MAG: FaeA/PapI family transcriptional regulator [Candidatus Pacearchaeota archaeon]
MKLHNKNKEILEFLKKNKVITSSELANYLSISWNTADKYLLELAFERKIDRIKKKGVNLWMLK